MKRYILIVAGGSGLRMGSDIPKQFLPVCGRPLLMHTIERMYTLSGEAEVFLVLAPSHIPYWSGLVTTHSFPVPHTVVEGGSERFHSVRNGLAVMSGNGLVAIHDGVRPLVSGNTVRACFEEAARSGAAIPVLPPAESLRLIRGESSEPLDRDIFRLVQTPQVFRLDLIRQAYRQAYVSGFTDDATVAGSAGISISLVDGNRENIKITGPGDLFYAEALLKGGFV